MSLNPSVVQRCRVCGDPIQKVVVGHLLLGWSHVSLLRADVPPHDAAPAGDHETPIRQRSPDRPVMLFARAVGFAENAHGDQLDKGGELYIYHCIRVGASLLPDINAAVAGLFHDVLEDTTTPAEALLDFILELLPSTGDAVFATVRLLTRDPAVEYEDYIAAIAPHFLARRVKLVDLSDNLNRERRRRALAFGADPVKMSLLADRYFSAVTVLRKAEGPNAL
jgi:hypothetical protein